MDQFPGSVLLLPDACFATAAGDRFSAVHALHQTGVTHHHGIVTEPAEMGSGHGHLRATGRGCTRGCCWGFVWKVEAMKVEAFHQMAIGFGFKAAERRSTQRCVARPVPTHGSLKELLVQFQDRAIPVDAGHGLICSVLNEVILSKGPALRAGLPSRSEKSTCIPA